MSELKQEIRRPFFSAISAILIPFTALSSILAKDSAHASAGCNQTPPAMAVQRAQNYYQTNRNMIEHGSNVRQGTPGRKIVINDYTQMPPQMFVLDATRTNQMGQPVCLFNFPVDFGMGGGTTPRPGCGHDEEMTPPGFHITTENVGGKKYPYPDGMGLVSCEGQESLARGVKIHAGPGRGLGRGVTWGCPALTDENYEKFLDEVRGGSLVYNFFGDLEASAQNCKQAINSNPRCTPEQSGGYSGPQPRNQQRGRVK